MRFSSRLAGWLLLLLVSGGFQKAFGQATIYLVRHAEKMADVGKDPDLSPAGRQRAQNLARLLAEAEIKHIYVTSWKRTQETAAPLAEMLHLQPEITTETESLVPKLKSADGNVLVVGHTNTIPAMLQALGVRAAITLDENAYDNLFILPRGDPASFIRLHF